MHSNTQDITESTFPSEPGCVHHKIAIDHETNVCLLMESLSVAKILARFTNGFNVSSKDAEYVFFYWISHYWQRKTDSLQTYYER